MMPAPVAYIRRSAADSDSPGDVSRSVQEQAVAELAHREGHNGDVRVFVDWARSADEEKAAKRTEYAAMLKAVEAGEVSTIYAYSLDRLNRSIVMTANLFSAAEAHGVRVVTHREGDLSDEANPMTWMYRNMSAMLSEWELRTIKQRAAGALQRRRARGDELGQPPFGYKVDHEEDTGRVVFVRDPEQPLDVILDTVREAGSILASCRQLEERGIPAPRGGRRWSLSALTRIVEREAPELLKPRGPSGHRGAGTPSPLTGLLVCHCGQRMTPNAARGQFYCSRGHLRGSTEHGKLSVTVDRLMPWIEAEAARLRTPESVLIGEAKDEEREALLARRRRIADAAIDGLIGRDEAKAKAAEIDAEVAMLDTREAVATVPTIDWSWPAEALNEALRAVWDHVQLDEAMQPVEAVWRVPEWRD